LAPRPGKLRPPAVRSRPTSKAIPFQEKETTFTKEFMKSKSSNTPFFDKTLKGSVEMVVLGDEILLER